MRIIDGHIHIFSEFTAEHLAVLMDKCGVEKALLLQNPTIGSVNEEIAEAINQYPERFAGVIQVDPYAVDASEQMASWMKRAPFAALKLELSTGWGWTGIYHDESFDYQQVYPLIRTAANYGLSVVIDTGDTGSAAYQPEAVSRMAAAFPQVKFVIEHGGYLTPDGNKELWYAMVRTAKRMNVWLGISAMAQLLQVEYPSLPALNLLQQLYHIVGAEKLIWGSDGPTVFENYTYRQLIDSVVKHARFLSAAELQKIMFENAETVFWKKAGR